MVALDRLITNQTVSYIQTLLYATNTFLNYLEVNKINIRIIRSAIIRNYGIYLDITGYSSEKKNLCMRAAAAAIEACNQMGAMQISTVIDCSRRWDARSEPARAPDRCVIEELDGVFFDSQHCRDIPNTYRCLYIMLRLICNRISETQLILIDCISYPTDGIYGISIPTKKETPYHDLQYHCYFRKLNGFCEAILFECLRKQQEYALSVQSVLSDDDKGYLFASPKRTGIVSTQEFNDFLETICRQYNILDATGNSAHITSHALRHAAVTERYQHGIISKYQAMVECNHHNLEQTDAYALPSNHDETETLKSIMQEVHNSERTDEHPTIQAHSVLPAKYKQLEASFSTRSIPGYGLCQNTSCHPQFENCIKCKHFVPDNLYVPYFEAAIRRTEEKLKTLSKKTPTAPIVARLKNEIEIYEAFLGKIKTTSTEEIA